MFIFTDKKNYSSERILDESGITVAPPPRLAATNSLPAPPTTVNLSHPTCQRRPDPPAATNTTSENVEKESDSESAETSESETTTNTGAVFFSCYLICYTDFFYC
jgi:hypothetical protein